MSADATNNNFSTTALVENPGHINMQSNNMIFVDENIIGDTINSSNNNCNHDINNNNITNINNDQTVVTEDNVVDSLFMDESGDTNENQESHLENIIMENEIINNIKYNNNPITEFNNNLLDNIKSIVDLFGNRPDTLIVELNRFVQKFLQQNIEEIQFLKVKNHTLQELIADLKSKAIENSSRQNNREESVILELSKLRREKSNIQISPPSPETNEYIQSSSSHPLLTGAASTNNNPLRRTRRIRKKSNEPVHKVSHNESSDEDEDDAQKMTDEHYSSNRRNSAEFRSLNNMRLHEMIEYPSSDVNQPESDDDDEETENESSTPEKPKKKKKKNTSEEDNDYLPKPNPKPQSQPQPHPRTNIISNHPSLSKTTLVSPPSSSSIASSSSSAHKPVNSSSNIKPSIPITNPITIINNSGPPTQTTTTTTPKRRGRPRRIRPEDTVNLQPSLSGPLGTVMPLTQDATKNSLSAAIANLPRIGSTASIGGTQDTTAPNSVSNNTATLSSITTSNNNAVSSIPSDKIKQGTNNADAQAIHPTEMSSRFSNIPPVFENPTSLQPNIQTNPSNGGESSSANNFSNIYNQMMSPSLLAQQKKRGPKPGPRRGGGSKAMFTIYDSNSFKLTYEKPGVTKITKASISNGPQTVFIDSDISQYADLANAVNSIGGNSMSQYGNASDSLSRPTTTNENISSSSSNNKTTLITTATPTQTNNIGNNINVNNSTSTAGASSTSAADTGTTSHNSSSKASRRFNSHASNMINSNLNASSGSPIISSDLHRTTVGGGILIMNPTSNNTAATTHPFLVPNATNSKRNNEPNNVRDYYAQILTESKEGAPPSWQDNRSVPESSSLAVVKHEEEEEDEIATPRQTLLNNDPMVASFNNGAPTQQQDQQNLPPPIVRIRLAPQVQPTIASSSTSGNNTTLGAFSNISNESATIEEKKKLFGRRVRKV